MPIEKTSLYETFNTTGDIRALIELIDKHSYTDEEASEVINIYEPYQDNYIPEVEHIVTLLTYFPKAKVSDNTMNAVQTCFPNMIEHIMFLQNKHN